MKPARRSVTKRYLLFLLIMSACFPITLIGGIVGAIKARDYYETDRPRLTMQFQPLLMTYEYKCPVCGHKDVIEEDLR